MSSKTKNIVTNTISDEQLIATIQADNTADEIKAEAFSNLYERYHRQICHYANSQISGSGNDILMATMVVMIEKIKSGKYVWLGKPFEAWLINIAKNKLKEYRRENQNISLTDIHEQTLLKNCVEEPEHYDESNTYEWLKNVGLSRYQCTIVLQRLRGRSLSDIAADLGRTYSAVRTAHSRSMKLLKANIDTFYQYR